MAVKNLGLKLIEEHDKLVQWTEGEQSVYFFNLMLSKSIEPVEQRRRELFVIAVGEGKIILC